jgi:hypothetical protein
VVRERACWSRRWEPIADGARSIAHPSVFAPAAVGVASS